MRVPGILSAVHSARPIVAVALLVVAVASCKTDASGPDGEFTITPDVVELFVGGSVQLTAVGAPSTPVWSSSNSAIATVVPQTGNVMGVGRGQATISAVAGSAVASVVATVMQPPGIALSAPTVDFDMTLGGANPAAQTITVQNSGDGTLGGVRVQAINYGEGQPAGWLSAAASGSTAPVNLTLTANGAGLPRGTYTATVLVAADGVSNSPQVLGVMFGVLAPAEIELSRTVVPMAGIPGSTINETFNVSNAGDRPLTDLSTSVSYPQGQASGWLVASLDATAAPTTVRLAASAQSLAIGVYNATVRVASGVIGVAAVNATVTLTVAPGPSIVLSSTAVPFQTATGQNPANQVVNVTNGGGGTLSGLTTGTITYGSGQPTGWLAATLAGSTAPTTVTLAVTSASLPIGSYTATVPVLSGVASNSPVNIVVNLNVGPPPVIALNPSNVLFIGWQGAATPPSLQGIQVTNSAVGMGPLPGLSFTVAYGPGGSGWLTTSFQGGNTSAPTTILLQPNVGSLAVGTYTATITVSSTVPGVASKTATVNFEVRSFTVNVWNAFFNPSPCVGCHGEFSGTPGQVYSDLGSRSDATLICKLFTPACHSGGLFSGLEGMMRSWMAAGRPQ